MAWYMEWPLFNESAWTLGELKPGCFTSLSQNNLIIIQVKGQMTLAGDHQMPFYSHLSCSSQWTLMALALSLEFRTPYGCLDYCRFGLLGIKKLIHPSSFFWWRSPSHNSFSARSGHSWRTCEGVWVSRSPVASWQRQSFMCEWHL